MHICGQNHQSHSFPFLTSSSTITSLPPPVSESDDERTGTSFISYAPCILVALASSPRCHKQSRYETLTGLQITITSEWFSQLRRTYISKHGLWAPLLSLTHMYTVTHAHAAGTLSSCWAQLAHVRYCTTKNMTTQVSSIPPIIKYLSWKARFSMSRITVLDKPSMLAMSRILF